MKPQTLWPIAVVGVLVMTVGANVAVFLAANGEGAAQVEPDYYRKAVAWDSTLAQAGRNQTLAWVCDARWERPRDRGAMLEARLTDAHGAALTGAEVRVTAIHNLGAASGVAIELAPVGPGLYRGRIVPARAGLWELRFEVTRGAVRFTSNLRRDQPAAETEGSTR